MAETVVTSDIAGVVFSVQAQAGEVVNPDQSLLVIEAMKMHIPVEAPRAGVVAAVLVAEGDVVAEGQALVRLT